MSRKYADHITVQCQPAAANCDGPPDRFVWRRRRYRVQTVLQRWIEAGSWWRGASSTDEEYEMWRVEAARERPVGQAGQFDLCRLRSSGAWFLVRAFD